MDVIAAIATGGAPTAIGIVRVSGPGCFSLCGRVFRAANGRTLEEQEPRRMVLGDVLDEQGRRLDQGLAVCFPGPGSFTGEDCAEFHCHEVNFNNLCLQGTLQTTFPANCGLGNWIIQRPRSFQPQRPSPRYWRGS